MLPVERVTRNHSLAGTACEENHALSQFFDWCDIKLQVVRARIPPRLRTRCHSSNTWTRNLLSNQFDAAIDRARRQIELLQEYRTRLIADVVTGKLDVREAAAQLPDEADDQDPIEERAAC